MNTLSPHTHTLFLSSEIGGIPRRPRQNPRRYRSPQEHDLFHENHSIVCSDGVAIHAWLILQPRPQTGTVPTLVFFHGNAGNIGLRLPNAVQMYQHLGCNILMVEYRGFGDSDTVTPSEAGLKLDAEASLRFLHDHAQIDKTQIFLFGRSLGGAVAFHLAQHAEQNSMDLAGIIVENTFLSIGLMVDHLMPLVAPVKGLVLRIGWNSFQIAPTLRTPILYLAGNKDTLVPHSHMLELYKLSSTSSMARIHIVENGTHNETWMQGGRKYWERIARFFLEVKASGNNRQSSMDDVSLGEIMATTSVKMGGGDAATSSIPMMPTSLLDTAKEAIVSMTTATTTSTSNNKKKE